PTATASPTSTTVPITNDTDAAGNRPIAWLNRAFTGA
ncbi:MAG: hypothetical protein QOK31_1424, partial [Solirubrobacteraceae bacterium]|nr:hypothetical protein [Solirubrobacteraceae bacterium]